MPSLYDSVGGGADSAVLALRSHLLEHWTGEGLVLGANLAPIPPFHGYQSTLEPYHAGYQRLNTLVITKRRFKKAFEMIPGLGALAEGAMALMSRVVRTLAFEHENIHVLRQVPGVPCGATFSPHRDDHSLRLLYTLILKLTADPVAAPPSQMQVFEPVEHPPLSYLSQAGSAIIFRSQDLHTSLAPAPALGTVVKVAFFFREKMCVKQVEAAPQGQRRSARS